VTQKLCKRFLFITFIKEYNYRAERKKERNRAEITLSIDRMIVKNKFLQLGQEIKEAEMTNLPTSHSHTFLTQLPPKVLGPRIRTPNCVLLSKKKPHRHA
jgi:hypothetical protein